jgi:serine/threonine protein kinase
LVSLTPGTILAQRYQIQQVLGKKAGRYTFLADDTDQTDNQQVVLKLLRFDREFEWDHLKLFEREAETLRSLHHPAIPRYLDFFELDTPDCKGFVLVQSYIDAPSLDTQIKNGRSFSEDELKQLAEAILEILIYLHSQNPPVVHRDIKPSNILLGDRSGHHIGQVYLVDFGSVQTLAAREGGTLTIVGTYGYMPPEQFGERAVPASDLYSLGATLIYLATGKHPADLPQRNLRLQFGSFVPDLDPHLIRWLQRLTEPDLSRRFSSASIALQSLKSGKIEIDQIHVPLGKPQGSQIVLSKTAEAIDITTPYYSFNDLLRDAIGFPIQSVRDLVDGFLSAPSHPLGWLILAFWLGPFFLALLMAIAFYLICMVWSIYIWLLRRRRRLRIDLQRIAMFTEIWGIPLNRIQARRQDICKLVWTYRYYRIKNGGRVEVPPRIQVWAGVQVFELERVLGDLSSPEQDWLVHELSDWLELPITRE